MTRHTSKNKKVALSAGLLTTGLVAGAMFSPLGLAGAQETDTDADSSADSTETDRRGRHGHKGEVAELLGIDSEDIKAGFEAGKTLVEIAAENGISEDELVAALVGASEEHLAEAVESGRVTQEKADEIAAGMAERIAERVNTVPAERDGEGHHRRGRFGGFEALEELGLTKEDLQAGREAGQTLAETAAANGVSEQELIDALVAGAMERADDAVESGRVTQEQGDEHLGDIEERISERVNSEPGDRPEGGRRGPGGPGGSGPEGDTEGASISF